MKSPNYVFMFLIYFILVGVAVSVGPVWHVDPLVPMHDSAFLPYGDVLAGSIVGLMMLAGSSVVQWMWKKYRDLNALVKEVLGDFGIMGALFLAGISSVGEEVFFRGFLQQLFDRVLYKDHLYGDYMAIFWVGIIFGVLHLGPNFRKHYPWMIFATLAGFVLGFLYALTGNLLAPILAHFVVNFVSLAKIGAWDASSEVEA